MINYISRTEYKTLMEQIPDDMVKSINDGLVRSSSHTQK